MIFQLPAAMPPLRHGCSSQPAPVRLLPALLAWLCLAGTLSAGIPARSEKPSGGTVGHGADLPAAPARGGTIEGGGALDTGTNLPTARDLAESSEGLFQSDEEKLPAVLRRARLAAAQKEFDLAERLYTQPLGMKVTEAQRQAALLELAAMYEDAGMTTKMAAVYEKFAKLFSDDARLPQIYLTLGHLYRQMGAHQVAIARFYNVLNVSLNVPENDIPVYKRLSMQAQLDIAETYFLTGDYENASKFFNRLQLLNLSPPARERVLFKTAYIDHLREDYPAVIAGLNSFLDDYPDSRLAPESHYLLAYAYRTMNRPDEAMKEVLTLLRHKHIQAGGDAEIWLYWQKKSANQMANEFYERGDFHGALKIYQAMAPLSRSPHWQWPVLYQIGLCFERLGMYPKAAEAYQLLATSQEWKGQPLELDEQLNSLREMARWRLEHVGWAETTRNQLQKVKQNRIELMDPADIEGIPNLSEVLPEAG